MIENLRIVRVAEVEVIGRAERDCAGAGEIATGFRDGDFAAFVRIEINVGGVAIDGEGDEFRNRGAVLRGLRERIVFDVNDRGIRAGRNDRAVADHVVVLAIDPVLG